jgi:hypothetical protein
MAENRLMTVHEDLGWNMAEVEAMYGEDWLDNWNSGT